PIIDTPYGTPTSQGLDASFLHFWLCDRSEVYAPMPDMSRWFLLPMPSDTRGYLAGLPKLDGNHRIVTLARSGRVSVSEPGPFDAQGLQPGGLVDSDSPFRAIWQGQ